MAGLQECHSPRQDCDPLAAVEGNFDRRERRIVIVFLSVIANPLNSSELTFPILECIHILAFAFSVGTIAIVDFRLLGLGMKKQTPAELNDDTQLWTMTGLLAMVFSGLLLFSSDPDNYYKNIPFDMKMFFLLLALIFHYTIHRRVIRKGASPAGYRITGAVSLTLWMCVIFGGIFIGFVNSTLDINRV